MADSTLTLVVGGEGFGGPPKFAVSFDGKPVGEGSVASAIDTAKAGRFADAADKTKYVQSFDFKVPDAVFKPDGIVAVKLTNEAHGAVGPRSDRQLYLQSVAVNGGKVPASKFAMRSAAGVEPTSMLGDFLVVSAEAVEGVANAPNGGWPKPAAVAETATKPVPDSAASAAVPPVAATPPAKPAEKQPPAAAPVTAAAQAPAPAPLTDRPVTAAEARDPADANPNPEANAPECGLSKSFQILGFNENSNDLTPRTRKALDLVVKAIGTQKCVVHLTGYSSTEGDIAHNALFSIERAQNALHYLTQQGVKFRRYSANGVGETRQFGANPNANRRVVVTVSP